jgi:hypothetical protein
VFLLYSSTGVGVRARSNCPHLLSKLPGQVNDVSLRAPSSAQPEQLKQLKQPDLIANRDCCNCQPINHFKKENAPKGESPLSQFCQSVALWTSPSPSPSPSLFTVFTAPITLCLCHILSINQLQSASFLHPPIHPPHIHSDRILDSSRNNVASTETAVKSNRHLVAAPHAQAIAWNSSQTTFALHIRVRTRIPLQHSIHDTQLIDSECLS